MVTLAIFKRVREEEIEGRLEGEISSSTVPPKQFVFLICIRVQKNGVHLYSYVRGNMKRYASKVLLHISPNFIKGDFFHPVYGALYEASNVFFIRDLLVI